MYNIDRLTSEEYNVNYFLKSGICRFCWRCGAQNRISDTKEDKISVFQSNTLLQAIHDCLNLAFDPGSNPNMICDACSSKIQEFYEFKSFCKASDLRLREILQNAGRCSPEKKESVDLKIEPSDVTELNGDPQADSEDFLPTIPSPSSSDNDIPLDKLKKLKKLKKSTKKYNKKRSATYCNICMKDFKTQEAFSSHNNEAHGIEDGFFKCFGCEKRFRFRRGRLSHENSFCKSLKDGYKCSQCERFLPTRRSYEKHMKDHRENAVVKLPETLFKCKKCGVRFDSRIKLNSHLESHGDEKRNYVCEECGKVFTRQDYLHKHSLTHTGVKRHVCVQCGYRTSQRSSLIVHIRKHTGERPYSCDLCPQKCISSSNLVAHRRRHLALKLFECTICNKKFGYKVSLDEHFASCHGRPLIYPCPICAVTYSRKRGLNRHMLAKHGKKYSDHLQDSKVKEGAVEDCSANTGLI